MLINQDKKKSGPLVLFHFPQKRISVKWRLSAWVDTNLWHHSPEMKRVQKGHKFQMRIDEVPLDLFWIQGFLDKTMYFNVFYTPEIDVFYAPRCTTGHMFLRTVPRSAQHQAS